MYEYCKPLYEQIKILCLTDGEFTADQESYPFCKFISREYPGLTILTESNGIAFDQKWQELASDNLFFTSFSVNAACGDTYARGVWNPAIGGQTVYSQIKTNVLAYIDKLRVKGRIAFAPAISMVINKDTSCDVRAFVRMALEWQAWGAAFYFDVEENNYGHRFGCPETSLAAAKDLMKIKRVLNTKFFVHFELFRATDDFKEVQSDVDAIPLDALKHEFADLLILAQDRSMHREHEERQRIRKIQGKKALTFDEEYTPTIREIEIDGNKVCFAPWKQMTIQLNGEVALCSWRKNELQIHDYIRNNGVDWDALFNALEIMKVRESHLNMDFDGCMPICPLNKQANTGSSSKSRANIHYKT